MSKALVVAGAVVAVGLVARRAMCHREGFSWAAAIERMPEDAPPKWMFRNITAIRENTERILEQLQTEDVAA
jgi:hypothetical protein